MEAGTKPVGRLLDGGQLGGVSIESVEGATDPVRSGLRETRDGFARPPTRWAFHRVGGAKLVAGLSFLICYLNDFPGLF